MPETWGGHSIETWFDIFMDCHASTGFGFARLAWPDGGSYLSQPALTIEMFNAFHWAIEKEREANVKNG